MSIILVTGGGGFIGSNLVAELARRSEYKVVVCDRFGTGEKWRNLSKHMVWEIVPPDALHNWLAANADDLAMIYHLGGVSSTTEKNVDSMLNENFRLSLTLWDWAVKNQKRFVYASSVATYGDGSQGFDDDITLSRMQQLKPLNCYGWSKHLFDLHVARTVAEKGKLPPQWVGLKLFNAYGPNEYHKESQKSVISQIAPHAIHGGTVKLFKSYNPKYPDGGQMRDVIYVKDMVRVMVWLLDNPAVAGLYNLGTGKPSTYSDMAKAIFAALGKPGHLHYIDMPEEIVHKYQYFTEAKMDRLRAAGYSIPFSSLNEAVRDYVQNYLVKEDPYL